MIMSLDGNQYLGQKETKMLRGAGSDVCHVEDGKGLRPLVMSDAVGEKYK